MTVSLVKASLSDVSILHELQLEAFTPLLNKYKDFETSPANETLDRIINRLNQPFTDYYLIHFTDLPIGAIRIVKRADHGYRVSPIFIIPKYQGKGIAQQVFRIIEETYDDAVSWELDTILQEQGNCYLYEKIGYKKTGETREINEKMTIVYYEKKMMLSK